MAIRGYYHETFKRGYFDGEKLQQELPPELAEDLSVFLKQTCLSKLPFLRNADHAVLKMLARQLRHEFYTSGEVIVEEGDVGHTMYFVDKGSVGVHYKHRDNDAEATKLASGSYFGELAILTDFLAVDGAWKRPSTVKAATNCDLYVLDKKDFDLMLENFPEFEKALQDTMNHSAHEPSFLTQGADMLLNVSESADMLLNVSESEVEGVRGREES
jgi:CRP-like cAMP-binding protein